MSSFHAAITSMAMYAGFGFALGVSIFVMICAAWVKIWNAVKRRWRGKVKS
jgi:hypothetical protein